MAKFIESTSGRLMSFSVSAALLGGGASALMQSPTSLYVMAFSTFGAVVGCVAALQLGIEDHHEETVMAVIFLPMLLFLYAVALGFVMNYYQAGAYAFLALGAGVLLVALRSLTVERPEAASSLAMSPRHAKVIEH